MLFILNHYKNKGCPKNLQLYETTKVYVILNILLKAQLISLAFEKFDFSFEDLVEGPIYLETTLQ